MENFGLVTIDESVLMYLGAALVPMQYGATLIAHELAHHWTGDLVTMKTFNDLFLNEAFAEFFQYLPFADGPFPNLTNMHDIFFLNENSLGLFFGTSFISSIISLIALSFYRYICQYSSFVTY